MEIVVRVEQGVRRLLPQAAREVLYGATLDEQLRDEVWREAVVRARQKPDRKGATSKEVWRLLTIWLALPGVYRTVHRVTSLLPVDRHDLEAEVVLALLEVIGTTDLDRSDVGGTIVRAAVNRAWGYARQTALEVPVVDIASIAAVRNACTSMDPGSVSENDWELHIEPPSRPDGLAAPLHFTVSRTTIEGERLGALAERLGLRDVVLRARRPGEGPVIGTLSLRPAGAAR
ncbi:hypothetical protein SMD44_04122 [Streptomyces alboflavus]|uniref:Uncharacterized protein n=1 Tax=Streptomyces alboflavus TaxID=67267 RepID=A0A1Z1WE16_9ACTN|nr:hypothetical protein [Streptomyces alboflavus]ARX84671.1 hypothetical protein SMD44_04122 [Streptomyces alboflavus]